MNREQLIELVLGLAARVVELEARLGQPPKMPGVNRIYVAGEIEYDLQSGRERDGVQIEESVLADLDTVKKEL